MVIAEYTGDDVDDNLQGATSKIRASVERLAGVFHIWENPTRGGLEKPISGETWNRANHVGLYWLGAVKNLHGMLGARDGDKHAETIVRWVERRVRDGKIDRPEFTHRTLTQGVRGTGNALGDPAVLKAAIGELISRSYLKEISEKPRVFAIHPDWWAEMQLAFSDPPNSTRITRKRGPNVGDACGSGGVLKTKGPEWDILAGNDPF